ncbi:sensor histidine kinase [Cellulomonas iranensis]|uniref:sensor histidine kinase n=1 Tax=Cellulomonas iranensis TaxID=76862 RepID=UPI000B3CD687|nr:histidine kinase [Cellulomonas iranensis]
MADAPVTRTTPRGAPWWRPVLAHAGTVVAVVVALFFGMGDAAFAGGVQGVSGVRLVLAVLGMVAAVGAAVALVWRRQHAVAICLAAAGVAVVLPVSGCAALLALPWVLASARTRTAVGCTAATGAAVGASLARDWSREGADVMWSVVDEATGRRSYLPAGGYVAFGVVALGLAVAAGLVRRSGAAARAAREVAADEARRSAQLRTQADHLRSELTRQDERELIAREMHDTVAHHLSLVSLHAAALEVTADDPGTDVPEAARSMRSSAHRALEEMRSLITTLRTAGETLAEQYAGPAPRLADLPVLLDDARGAGVDIGATVFVDGGDAAPPALTRAVYRVVQESLTNAMKHAPGARVHVDLRARPGAGVDVVVRNRLAADGGGSSVPSAGAGLVGMSERAQALGGSLTAGVERDEYVVRAHLPWVLGA